MPIIVQPPGADLFESGAEMLVNTVNTQGVMGAGLALQFKRRFPRMFEAYRANCHDGLVRVERIDAHLVAADPAGRRIVANFPTKDHWRDPSRLEWIEAGLTDLVALVSRTGVRSVAMPPLGCGLGGLDWTAVRPLVIESMRPVSTAGVEVLLFTPDQTG